MLRRCPEVTILATSREPLRCRARRPGGSRAPADRSEAASSSSSPAHAMRIPAFACARRTPRTSSAICDRGSTGCRSHSSSPRPASPLSPRADRRTPRRQPRRPLDRAPDRVDAPADAARDDHVEPRAAERRGARALPAARGLRRLVLARRRGRVCAGGPIERQRRRRPPRTARRQVARRSSTTTSRALPAARHDAAVRRGTARRRPASARRSSRGLRRLGADLAVQARSRRSPSSSSITTTSGRARFRVSATIRRARSGSPRASGASGSTATTSPKASGALRAVLDAAPEADRAARNHAAGGRRARAALRRASMVHRECARSRGPGARRGQQTFAADIVHRAGLLYVAGLDARRRARRPATDALELVGDGPGATRASILGVSSLVPYYLGELAEARQRLECRRSMSSTAVPAERRRSSRASHSASPSFPRARGPRCGRCSRRRSCSSTVSTRAVRVAYTLCNLAALERTAGRRDAARAALDDALARFRRLRDERGRSTRARGAREPRAHFGDPDRRLDVARAVRGTCAAATATGVRSG